MKQLDLEAACAVAGGDDGGAGSTSYQTPYGIAAGGPSDCTYVGMAGGAVFGPAGAAVAGAACMALPGMPGGAGTYNSAAGSGSGGSQALPPVSNYDAP